MKYKGEIGEVWKVPFQHIVMYKTQRHVCLERGYWCLENLREHPKDIIKFIKTKLS